MRLSPLALAITLTLAACSQPGTRSEVAQQSATEPSPVTAPAEVDAIVVASDEEAGAADAAASAADAAGNAVMAAKAASAEGGRRDAQLRMRQEAKSVGELAYAPPAPMSAPPPPRRASLTASPACRSRW